MDYSKYKTEDFLLDPEFRKWVMKPSPQSNLYWEAFLEQHPHKLREVTSAREILLQMPWQKSRFEAGEMEKLWEDIDQQTKKNDKTSNDPIIPISSQSIIGRASLSHHRHGTGKVQAMRIAAILLLVIAASYLLLIYTNNYREDGLPVQALKSTVSPPGSKLHLMLPDGTKAVLNAGSKLSYYPNFTDSMREVFLVGEAFFEVQKDAKRSFVVHAGGLATTALGTSFNIRAYVQAPVEVALMSGAVEVVMESNTSAADLLAPGQMAIYDPVGQEVKKEHFNADQVTAWKDGILVLKTANKAEIIDRLEHWYGVKIIEELKSQPKEWSYSGRFDNQSLKNVLVAMSYSLNFEFSISRDTVRIYN